jgi:uncharacterized protein YrrD
MAKYDLNIGAPVRCEDGACGRLTKVVIDVYTERITDVVVEKGLLLSTDRVIPIAKVEHADEDGVQLSLSADELAAYPEYREVEYTEPSAGARAGKYDRGDVRCYNGTYSQACETPVVPSVRHTVHPGLDSDRGFVGRGTRVLNPEGEVATVDHVLVDPESGEITHLVLRRGLFPKYPILSIKDVDEFGDDVVTVNLSEEQIEALPHYRRRSAEDIEAELTDRYAKSSQEFDDVEVSVEGGIAHLSGTVPDVEAKRHAEAIARAAPGIIDVENDLESDE